MTSEIETTITPIHGLYVCTPSLAPPDHDTWVTPRNSTNDAIAVVAKMAGGWREEEWGGRTYE